MIERHFFGIEMQLAEQVGNRRDDALHGYRLHLPLTPEGHIDSSAFLDHADAFKVARWRRGESKQHGQILRGGFQADGPSDMMVRATLPMRRVFGCRRRVLRLGVFCQSQRTTALLAPSRSSP